MGARKIKGDYFRFFIYFIVIVLINIAGVTLFFRADLTENKIYSLSKASRDVVKTLSEPLSIKIFFTRDLPAPHNNTERYLHDLMAEYAAVSGRLFNYQFYDVTPKESGLTGQTDVNRQLARDYGISPVQIRIIENDEMKFKQAYMGLVIIHGDMVEKIPAITSTGGLEYQLTTAIQKLNNKVSALLSLEDSIELTMYLSSSLNDVAPLMGLDNLPTLPDQVQSVAEKLNSRCLGKMDFKYIDPTQQGNTIEIAEKYNIMTLKWPDLDKKGIQGGTGCAGVVMAYQDKSQTIPLISSVNIPIFGTQYQMVEPDSLEAVFSRTMESLIGINQDIGYVSSHGTGFLSAGSMGMMQGQQGDMNVFNSLVSRNYSINQIDLKENGIPAGLECLVIAGPTERFSNYELFQIDQALMRGTNLALFPDAFNEVMPDQNTGYNMGPRYVPVDTGLDKLLEHYGLKVKKSLVMDENCYKQMLPGNRGGGEQKIYFAPMIRDSQINNDLDFMKNIRGLVAMKISPLEMDQKKFEKNRVQGFTLFSSSTASWEMEKNINLNPLYIRPPSDSGEKASYPLACLLEGEFPSYFAGKKIPEKEAGEADASKDASAGDKEALLKGVSADNQFVKKGKKGKVFVMACSQMLRDNMLDSRGETPNAAFILNLLDHLNNRDDIAVMRSKDQRLNPLAETTPFARGVIKLFNIAGLPVLVVLFGLGVWIRRGSRKKMIRMMFSAGS
ncbi:MAG: Gldg family protein [Thermodesulfobacteriota bacterium]|nr:Gldg family protein [Thermodesulfobacteriota bacterium]